MRSEAELAEIVEQLTEHQDSEDKQFECAASVPDMLINPVDRARRFYNENGKRRFTCRNRDRPTQTRDWLHISQSETSIS